MVNLPLASSSWDGDELKAIQEVISSGNFTMGSKVSEYETQFANYFGAKYAVMTSSGSAANLLMVASLFMTRQNKFKRGDEIIVPTVSWSTTYSPLQQYGLKLVFVDIDPFTLNFDIQKLSKAISKKTKAIFAVNFLGNPNDFISIKKMTENRDITILEDNCASMGAQFEGKYAGTFGLMGTFSTFFSHHISTMEGGCVVTNNEEIYHILLALRAHGWTRDVPKENHITATKTNNSFEESFKFVLPGYNVRPLNMSGAIGLEQLKKLSKIITVRRENAKSFQNLFEDHPYIQIQRELGTSSWYGFAIIIKEHADVDRQDIVNKLSKNGVEVRPIMAGNFLRHEVIKYFDHRVEGKTEAAEYLDKKGLYIGNHHFDIRKQLAEISKILK